MVVDGVAYDGIEFSHPGHASVRIESEGVVVYIDPWRDVVDGEPGDADVVVVTHDDDDHYDPDGIDAVSNDATTVVAYEAIDTSDLGRPVTPLAADATVTVHGLSVEAVPAYNRADGDHVDDDGNPYHAVGEVVGVVVDIGDTTVYFPSDTDFLDDHRDLRADVVIPPIGGTYTMDRHEAAALAEAVGAALVLPVHYDTFEAIETDAEAFADDVEARGMRVELF
ncbi:MBL fold metallo-hydrolase [Salinigranum halophilum]|jgi:L-ascorbate metabolism protein UlaG (beta-lactamase superfamily)|uniref:MBL fold metallo-hydrolase n=1 Tax=Salinigranum halophilum TaxID=2565931 RepID=UPI0010A750FD|nr:MBL fold metallo-hydrolase [Salinigranum halophilum]